MSLPPTYDCPAAIKRITNGLVKLGCNPAKAERAAQVALDEAPFDKPTDEGWGIACKRARHLAGAQRIEDELWKIAPDGIKPE